MQPMFTAGNLYKNESTFKVFPLDKQTLNASLPRRCRLRSKYVDSWSHYHVQYGPCAVYFCSFSFLFFGKT